MEVCIIKFDKADGVSLIRPGVVLYNPDTNRSVCAPLELHGSKEYVMEHDYLVNAEYDTFRDKFPEDNIARPYVNLAYTQSILKKNIGRVIGTISNSQTQIIKHKLLENI